ncbi:MAG: hypothetical protein ACRCXC_06930 [Legionella sp.]
MQWNLANSDLLLKVELKQDKLNFLEHMLQERMSKHPLEAKTALLEAEFYHHLKNHLHLLVAHARSYKALYTELFQQKYDQNKAQFLKQEQCMDALLKWIDDFKRENLFSMVETREQIGLVKKQTTRESTQREESLSSRHYFFSEQTTALKKHTESLRGNPPIFNRS